MFIDNRLNDEFLIKLKEIGKEILNIYNSTNIKYENKDDNSPLTKADTLSHKMLVEFLSSKTNYPVLSEESINFQVEDENQKIWIIDPLDGTKDFIQKTDEFSIMIALIENKKPIFSVVYLPCLDTFYYAIKSKGAYELKNDILTKLNVSDISSFEKSNVVISRNHIREKDKKVLDSLNIKKYIKMGSVGIKFCAIAKGIAEFSFYTTSHLGIWDCVSSHLILQEAKGEVFDSRGLEPNYDLKSKKMKYGFFGTNSKLDKNRILKTVNDNNSNGFVLWFTGFSGSGKTTLANEIAQKLYELNINFERLNGDELRQHITSDLTYNREDRIKNIKTVSYIVNLLTKNNIRVVADFITPYNEMREYLKNNTCNYIEIFVNAPLEECERRDVKGLYKKAREGLIKNFTGITDSYDVPINPDIILNTKEESIQESVKKIVDYLKTRKFI